MCEHPTKSLIGTARGIECQACGKVFSTFEEIHANAEKVTPADAKPKKARKKANA